ncbi:PREDICTED: ran GTPase-activating protein 1-like [Amphimedon queenslandica]|uniref:Ran-GTPase activating protein 1 C-terminal domain-containing protein n=1 Tax=Amphimedon queenslandica TaxID=400682 RepID=A0A1X7U3A6_AMPQE|nr:PREDICTED: ran GTPase-activating protein 1-like [Amphimedon queenslandica]|eukprot:XP_019856319.1 PREDICTED: ran GTPase-activating protein 1-like [Amphimedon queenslandica]
MADESKSVEVVVNGENKKIDSEEDVGEILHQIRDAAGITSLKLSGNSYGTEAASAIGKLLENVGGSLRHALWSDMFVSRLKTEIPPALSSLGNGLIVAGARLVELDLSDNAFGPAGVEGVSTLLTSEVCYTLKILKFNNNGLGIGGGKILSKALLQCYQEASEVGAKFALEVFQSGRNRLENDGARALAEVFETLGSLVELSMPQNGIYCDGISALARALKKNPHLRVLNLSDNTFTEDGSALMADVIPSLQELEVINFGECLVRSKGAVAIAEAVKDGHQMLRELWLSYNELDINSGAAIVSALSNKSQLAVLDLNGNAFGEEGVERIQEMMEAAGLEQALQSLSDDEGEETEDEDGESNKEEEEEENGLLDDSVKEEAITKTVTLDEWLESPSVQYYLGLNNRISLLQDYLTENPAAEKLAETYTKVAIGYQSTSEGGVPSDHRAAVHEFIDKCCEPFLSQGEENMLSFLNIFLSLVGLIKHEDKKFKPFESVDGPLLVTVEYLSKKAYFSSKCHEMLLALITKSCSVPKFIKIGPTLLTTLHS